MAPEKASDTSAEPQQVEPPRRLTRESVVLSVEQWQRETEEMGEALGGVFELSDDVATTHLK
jgi:hypothetical protein